ncbi:single-stranded DNA-binding protein [candidate division NPL-UPA2 bacterium]|nr:single-stranded DNA-binding protein [candidate division NPL-UPA2 bacterium]
MANLNQVFLIGNLTRDPELRYVPSGKAVANLGLATSRVFTTQEGEKREEVCFVRVVVWGKQAENCSQYLNKGSQICVEGRLQSRSWEAEDGTKRNALEVVARRIQFLDKIGKSTGGGEINREEADKAAAEEMPSSGENSL